MAVVVCVSIMTALQGGTTRLRYLAGADFLLFVTCQDRL
jgi:hypothetical protein